MSEQHWLLGIDFGTSNTAAAHTSAVSGSIEALQLSHNRTTMSSSVFIESPEQVDVGDVAVNRAESNPAAFVPSPKRLVGQGVVGVNGYTLPASVPVAAVLDAVVKRAAAAHAGTMPSQLVLTHPEAWSPREIQVLLDAAASLGLDRASVVTVSEPRAAAHHYSRSTPLHEGADIAVFDFGGGTLDVAVLRASRNGGFDVVAARGDNGVGGKNFDALLRRWVDEQLGVVNPELLDFLRAAPVAVRHSLDDSIRRAKELLSEAPSATITVAGGGFHETLQITRDEFEEIIDPALAKAVALTTATLRDAGIAGPSQLVALYLTGGSSRIPLVHDRLKDLGPLATLDDPKTVVAQGALASVRQAPAPERADLGRYRHAGQAVDRPIDAEPAVAAQSLSPGIDPLRFGSPATATAPSPTRHAPTGGAEAVGVKSRASGKKGLLAGAVALVVAIGVAVAGGIAFLGDEGDDVLAGATGNAASDGATSGERTTPTKEAVIAVIPAALRAELDLESCKDAGESHDGLGRKVQCRYVDDSEQLDGLMAESQLGRSYSVMIGIDPGTAKRNVQQFRDGVGRLTQDRERDLVEDGARQAAARIEGTKPDSEFGANYSVTYANYVSGLTLFTDGFASLDAGGEWLERVGVI